MNRVKSLIVTLFVAIAFTAQASEETFKRIPEECDIIISINVAEIIKVPVIKGLIDMNKAKLKENDIDIDMVKSMVVGTKYVDPSVSGGDPKDQKFFGLIETNKPMNLETYIKENMKDKADSIKKAKLLDKEYFEGTQDGVTVGAYQISETKFIVGTIDLLHKGIMLDKGMGKSSNDNEMLKKLVKLDGGLIVAGGVLSATPDLNGFNLQLNYNKGLKLLSNVYCKKEEKASEMTMQSSMMVGMMTANPELGLKADNIKITNKGKIINADIFIPEEVLAKLPGMFMSMMMGPSGGIPDQQ